MSRAVAPQARVARLHSDDSGAAALRCAGRHAEVHATRRAARGAQLVFNQNRVAGVDGGKEGEQANEGTSSDHRHSLKAHVDHYHHYVVLLASSQLVSVSIYRASGPRGASEQPVCSLDRLR